jgi:hypothetical protein
MPVGVARQVLVDRELARRASRAAGHSVWQRDRGAAELPVWPPAGPQAGVDHPPQNRAEPKKLQGGWVQRDEPDEEQWLDAAGLPPAFQAQELPGLPGGS